MMHQVSVESVLTVSHIFVAGNLTSQSVISQETQTSHPILIQGYLICTKIAARSPRLTHTCDSLVWEFIVLNSPYLNFIG